MGLLSGLRSVVGMCQSYTPHNHPIRGPVLDDFRSRLATDGFDRPAKVAAVWRIPKSFPGDGSNRATAMFRMRDQQALRSVASTSRTARDLIDKARKGIATGKKHLMTPAGDLLARATELQEGVVPLPVVLDLFDAYDAAGVPRRALRVKVGAPSYFMRIGHRAMGRYEATYDAHYYDIAARAYDRADALRGAPSKHSATLTRVAPATHSLPDTMLPGSRR